MSSLALPSNEALLPLLGRTQKREGVEKLILGYAQGHAVMDVAIGAAGLLPIPGAGLAAMIATIGAQGPVIYQPLAREIATIYGRQVGSNDRSEILKGAVGGGLRDIAVDLGRDFFSEIAGELTQELGLGGLISIIPVLGGVVGMVLDVKIAWTMTWRVGLMLALYHENGSEWVGSRKHTYELVRKRIKMDRDRGQSRPTIRQIVEGTPVVGTSQKTSVNIVATILMQSGLSKTAVRASLLERGIPLDLVDAVLATLNVE